MRDNHLSVVTLEEFEPNREFVGRNFNAGEVIQLVLKSPSSGRWLPFEYVQMVMMHELAHCKQMNHSRAFWAVRNQYATQMYSLWAKGYTGDGIWGRGASLASGEWESNSVREGEVLPEHLCGGTFRSRGRQRGRKRKPKLSYKEQKERRILKKFGKNGVALGADEQEKVKLEKGKKVASKPRVAGSARGRELRAAAALARFDKQKKEEEEEWDVKEEEVVADDETASESEFEEVVEGKDALNLDGTKMLDKDGHALVKVCEDEDAADPSARTELDELRNVFRGNKVKTESGSSRASSSAQQALGTRVKDEPGEDTPELSVIPPQKSTKEVPIKQESKSTQPQITFPSPSSTTTTSAKPTTTWCSICSYENTLHTLTCAMCSNVLDPSLAPGSWQCKADSCKDTAYFNCADSGTCGVCGRRK